MRSRASVLIVESRPNTRTFLEMTLSQEGMRVFSAVNLSSALLQLRVLRPDLIILGLARQADGERAAEVQIKALSDAPLLMLEGLAGSARGPGSTEMPSFLFNAGELCARVARALEGHVPA